MAHTKTVTSKAAARPVAGRPATDSALAQQFGGHYVGGWMGAIPASWVPYVQLVRLHRPHGLIVVLLSHLIGVLHAAILLQSPVQHTARVTAVVLIGAFFCNCGAHAWNDLVDAPIDAQVERTKTRPIPRGAITRQAALCFTAVQAALAAACLQLLSRDTTIAALVATAAGLYYPFAKRHMPVPQLVIGASMGLFVLVGSAAVGFDQPWCDASILCLSAGTMLWVMVFDTIYAHLDVADDTRLGINSLAVLVHGFVRPVLALMVAGMAVLMYCAGLHAGLGTAYNVLAVGGTSLCVGGIVALLDPQDPASCGRYSVAGFRVSGYCVLGGLLATYAASLF